MHTLGLIIAATFGVSFLSLAALLVLTFKKSWLHQSLLGLVALSAGGLMGAAFLHLLPEAVEHFPDSKLPFMVTLASFVAFFLLERVLHWQHCHDDECEVHSFGYLNLIGDTLHNFLDGLIIAAAFLVDPQLGWITTLAIAAHEIPQELGDFGVLVHAGFSRKIAILANFGIALTAILGGVLGYFIGEASEHFVPYLIAVAAGGFLYIASSDLLPELRKEQQLSKTIVSFVLFVAGVLLVAAVGMLETGVH
jgi:zinc and cadmium transporter